MKRRACCCIALAGSLLGLAGCTPGYDPVLNPLGPVPGAKPVRLHPEVSVTPYSVRVPVTIYAARLTELNLAETRRLGSE